MSRVLMVDDAALFQDLEASFLRRLGCAIVRVANLHQVVERARAEAPDLILLAVEHPGIDGPECVRVLKSDALLKTVPILVVTSPEGLPRCFEAGADAALARPLGAGALELALCSLGRVSLRGGPRRVAHFPVRIASAAGDLRGRLKDISRTGLFLTLARSLPVEESISLTLKLPGWEGRQSVRTRAVVVRQVPEDPESHLIPGVGVRFLEMDQDTESLIEHYVNEEVLEAGSAGPEDLTNRKRG